MNDYPRFETVPYRPEGGFTPGGTALLLLGSLLGGLVLGVIAGFIIRWFYLVLIFPIFIGAAVGGIGYAAIRVGKVRNVVLGAISGLLGGFFAMLVMHYMNYMEFERQTAAQVAPQDRLIGVKLARMTPAELDALNVPPQMKAALSDPVVRANLLVEDFPTYMHFRATAGVTLSSSRTFDKKDKGMNLGYVGSWIYWIVEVLIVAGIALAMQSLATKHPFCSECNTWKEERNLGALPDTDVAALRDGNLPHFSTPPDPAPMSLVMVAASICPNCLDNGEVDVKISEILQTNEGTNYKEIAHVTYPGEALPYLERIFQPAPPLPEIPNGDVDNGSPQDDPPLPPSQQVTEK